MNRRAFTLLELVLAMALGTVVVGVAWGLMISVDRADRSIEAAGADASSLEKARLVMSRTASSILMAPGSDPRKIAPKDGEATDDKTKTRRRNRVGINPDDPLPTPRIMLTPDPLSGGLMVPARSPLDATLLGDRLMTAGALGMGVVPQKLEIVLVDPPVPMTVDRFEAARRVLRRHTSRQDRISAAVGDSEDAEAAADAAAETEAEDPDVAVRAFRGMFQFRQEEPTEDETRRMQAGEIVRPRWRLEWQALMPRATYAQDAEPPPAVFDGPARVIANDLVYANWIFFDNGERKSLFEGTWGGDLPAYVEVELETSRGVQVNWMFEIGWAFGPEVPPVAPAIDSRIGKPGANASGDSKGDSKDGGGGASPSPSPSPAPSPAPGPQKGGAK